MLMLLAWWSTDETFKLECGNAQCQCKIVDSERLMGHSIKQLEPVELILGRFECINVSRFSNGQYSADPYISEV